MGTSRESQETNYFVSTQDTWNSMLLVLPLLLFYQVGLFVSQFSGKNGADFLTPLLFRYGGHKTLVVFHLLLLFTFVWLASHKKRAPLSPIYLIFLFVESILYAVVMVILINLTLYTVDIKYSLLALTAFLMIPYLYFLWERKREGALARFSLVLLEMGMFLAFLVFGFVLFQVFQAARWDQLPEDSLERLVKAVGAGVNEELLFRLLLFGGFFTFATKYIEWEKYPSFLLGAILSSLLFSLAHYVGPAADLFTISTFVYRFLAGVFFCILFLIRGFASCVYVHALYDVMVFFQDIWRSG